MWRDITAAMKDIVSGLVRSPVWLALAQEDIGDQHKRTMLGPLWVLVNYLAFAAVFIFVFQRGDSDSVNYAAYVATGLLVWFFIMESISKSVTLFVREEGFIKGTTLPLTVYVMRLATQSVIRAGYSLIGCLAILLLSGVEPSLAWGWSILGVLVVLLIAPAAITVVAFIGAFFPDSQFVVSNLMRVGMFITPVFWTLESRDSGVRAALYDWNPFTYFLEIVRTPILAGELPVMSLAICLVTGLVLWCFAILLLGHFGKRVAFVL